MIFAVLAFVVGAAVVVAMVMSLFLRRHAESVVPADGYDAAVMAANGVRYGLSASIFTSDVHTAFRAMRDLEAGIVYVNAGTTGAETHLPFGGWKETGNGHREAGHAALDTFTEWKSIYVDYSGRLQRAQIDNQP